MICGTRRGRRYSRMPYAHNTYTIDGLSPLIHGRASSSSTDLFFLSSSSSSSLFLACLCLLHRGYLLQLYASFLPSRFLFPNGCVVGAKKGTRPQRSVSCACVCVARLLLFLAFACLCPKDVLEGTRCASRACHKAEKENKKNRNVGV